jgi:hypothetical protein
VVSDDFNDGIRNRLLWQKSAFDPSTQLLEVNQRLYFSTGDEDLLDSTFALWRLKAARVLVDADVLETTALISLPVYPSSEPGAVIRLGLLWTDPANAVNSVNFAVEMTPLLRTLFVSYGGSGGSGGVRRFTFPAGTRNLYLKLRYSCLTDKTTFFWRRPRDTVWTRLPFNIRLNTLWSVPFNSVSIKSALLAESEGFWLQFDDDMYFDNFVLTHYMPPL